MAARAPRKPREKVKAPGWEHYFPIARGRTFEVVLERPPLPVRGHGTVVKRTAAALHLKLEVPGGFLIPKMSADVQLSYSGEGRGNGIQVDVQLGSRRESFSDDDVTIASLPGKRSRELAASLAHRGRSPRAVVHATGDGECRISVMSFEVRLVARPA